MSATLSSPARGLPDLLLWQIRRAGPLGAIVLLHVGFFYALQSGLPKHQTTHAAAPKEVIATFVTPQPAPEPPKPQPAAPKPVEPKPKTVPIVKKTAAPRPKTPTVDPAPAPQAVTAPPAEPTPAPAAPVASAAPSPAVPAAPAQPKTITTGIEYLQPPQPEYPPVARRMGEEGKVLLRVLVNEKGRPERVEVQKSSGSARLDEAARQAVLRALFKPFIEDGKAVVAYALVPIKFQLDN